MGVGRGPDGAPRGATVLRGPLPASAPLGRPVAGRRCLDAGASSGGFTDVLLRSGAAEVVAVDVGYGQLHWSLQQDERVVVHDRTNVRTLTAEQIGGPVDVVVGDLSFISLTLVLAALIGVTEPDVDLVPMVKREFAVGNELVGKGGVVRDPSVRAAAVARVAEEAAARGWGARAVTISPLPGPSGNVECFLWLRRGDAAVDAAAVRAAVEAENLGPGAARADRAVLGERPERVGP